MEISLGRTVSLLPLKIRHILSIGLGKASRYAIEEVLYLWFFFFALIFFRVMVWRNQFFPRKSNSVCFIGNNYNSFYTLSQALRKRGWRAISINPYPRCPFVQNQDILMDSISIGDSIKIFFHIIFHYRVVHLYNSMEESIYRGPNPLWKKLLNPTNLKRCGVSILFTPSGCLDGATSEEINELTTGLCNKCIWQGNDVVCNEKRNQQKIDWISKNCALFSNEVDLPKKLSRTEIGLNIPLMPLCSQALDPKMTVPDSYKIHKKKEEVLVFTAYGNEAIRSNDKRDIKGKKFIKVAIDRLIKEGYPVKHFHATSIPARDMKYYQVQADIIIDQLNYGTIGSAGREGMMLRKPVICHVSELMRSANIAMQDCPVINATEDSIYEVLKKTALMSSEDRHHIGEASREWMLKWFEADVCAERYERILSCLSKGESLHPETKFL